MGPVGSKDEYETAKISWGSDSWLELEESFLRVRKLFCGAETPADALGGCQKISWEVNVWFEKENQ